MVKKYKIYKVTASNYRTLLGSVSSMDSVKPIARRALKRALDGTYILVEDKTEVVALIRQGSKFLK